MTLPSHHCTDLFHLCSAGGEDNCTSELISHFFGNMNFKSRRNMICSLASNPSSRLSTPLQLALGNHGADCLCTEHWDGDWEQSYTHSVTLAYKLFLQALFLNWWLAALVSVISIARGASKHGTVTLHLKFEIVKTGSFSSPVRIGPLF